MKYDFQLDLDWNTSTGKIVAAVKPGSRVLEFGPGNGRISHYLIEEKNCQVAIVEYDEELFKHVMQFVQDGYLGNIEDYQWVEHFTGQDFDYILFGDVLEHLLNPEKALAAVIPFLRPDGQILITYPNLSHNSVLIDLFNNKLTWREFGLLDRTHKSFYTTEGFEKWFTSIGLYIAVEDYTFAPVGNIEIDAKYEDLPLPAQLPFRRRPFGEVYQYFFALTKNKPLRKQVYPLYNSNDQLDLRIKRIYTDHEDTEIQALNLRTKEQFLFTFAPEAKLERIIIYPLHQSGIIRFSAFAGGERLPFQTNSIWSDGHTFVFASETGYIELDFAALQHNEVQVILSYPYIGLLDPIVQSFVRESQVREQQRQLLEEELATVKDRYYLSRNAERKQGLKVTSKKVLAEKVGFSVDSIENDPETRTVVVCGWGYSLTDRQPLNYSVLPTEGASYTVEATERPDVATGFELDPELEYGFQITIEGYQVDKLFHLVMQLADGETLVAKVDRTQIGKTSLRTRVGFALRLMKDKGLSSSLHYISYRLRHKNLYQAWINKHEQYDQTAIQKEIERFACQPKISIVVPVYNVEQQWLDTMVASLKAQFYPNWELCLADDCSTLEYLPAALKQLAADDERIKVVFREKNGHISEATNSAIELATGEYIGFMDNDDELAPDALFEVARAINRNPNIDFFYSDEDKITVEGERFDPFFKPDWNPTLLLGHNYITHFVVVKRDLLTKVGPLRSEFNGSQDYDFVLRATEAAAEIYHIPRILYHWRTVETSTAFDPKSKEYAYIAGQHALEQALKRRNINGHVTMTPNYGTYKITYASEQQPLVSILLFQNGGDPKETMRAILENTQYPHYEIVTTPEIAQEFAADSHLTISQAEKMNERAAAAKGQYLFFMNDTAIPTNSAWLTELLNYAQSAQVGIVGGKVVNAKDIILNAGVSFLEDEEVMQLDQRGESNKSLGYYFRIALPRDVYAVTEEALLIRKEDFQLLGGFNEDLPPQARGVDLCLKVRNQLQKRIIWEPYSVLQDIHQASRELTKKDVHQLLQERKVQEYRDPYANLNRLDK